jgi:multidrug efflux pump subunit AcrA (membrane-fusion protein)
MRLVKIFGILLVLSVVVFTSFSCKSNSTTTATATTRTATVTKGTLTNSITGTGNLAYSTTNELAFEIPGYVEEVLVNEGDTVTKAQELVKLNTSDWEDQITALTKTLTTAQRALVTAERTLAAKQRTLAALQVTLVAKQRAVTTSELALKQAQIDVDSANYAFSQIEEVKEAQDIVDGIQLNIDIAIANMNLANLTGDRSWTQQIADFQEQLKTANDHLTAIKNLTDTSLDTSSALSIAKAKLTVEQKQNALITAQQAVIDANTAVSNAQIDIENAQLDVQDAQTSISDAQQSVQDAQTALDEAKSLSPTIYAPFDGYIISIKVSGGDEVQKGTVALTIADPSQFQADILVTENDIPNVQLDGQATVSLDALSDLTFPAAITWIAPTATVSSGVVNYKVTVTLTSLQPINGSNQTYQLNSTRGELSTGTFPSGATPPEGFTPPAGFTPPEGFTPPAGFTPPSGNASVPGANTSEAAAAAVANTSLKEGLSATVSIIYEQIENVLYVPSKAISREGSNLTVTVVNGTATEDRTVKTGMTDGTNTEITEGLKEGEKVTYTSTSSSSSTNTRSFGVISGPPGGF